MGTRPLAADLPTFPSVDPKRSTTSKMRGPIDVPLGELPSRSVAAATCDARPAGSSRCNAAE
jgi:hypothetical protein